ncbi:aldehyde dehydrogenase family protein [Salibacterium halotolerans]|uniref:Aldehyde dehydrogenase n=1 Tax=Salibacterium halotolerans TaxID=1884432 RepID=A0A1I5RLL5_9BACI|nr:aldehyde dehydrogenase family protein [Salibacterium halotolerans]SFP58806.1 Acyl-CoA reductase [Salibacterium halotolerans]
MVLKAQAPSDGAVLGSFEETPAAETGRIYENSRAARDSWATLSTVQRSAYLKRFRHVLIDLQEEIADIISASTGKTKTDALTTEVMGAADALKHVEKEAPGLMSNEKVKTPIHFAGKASYINRKPRGTVLIISPWNFPFQLAVSPVAEALAAGNTVILKPSEDTPMVGELLRRLAALFPKDVLQVVMGDPDLGEALTSGNPDFIHFTGSVSTGRKIQEKAAKELIPTTLELGGKDAMTVFEDANVTRAAKAAVWGSFHNSGQVCLSTERVFVQKGIYDSFLTEVKQEAAKLRQGQDTDADIGSMTTRRQYDHVKEQVQEALDQGAVLETGKVPANWDDSNLFIEPVILTNVTPSMALWSVETFGPVMPIMAFETEKEAVTLANDTEYGLGGSVFTSDIPRAERFTAGMKTGNMNINEVLLSVANFYLPYGGVKNSGIGKYHGRDGMRSFCIETSVLADKGTEDNEIIWYPNAGKYDLFLDMISNFWGQRRNWKSFIQSYMNLNKS